MLRHTAFALERGLSIHCCLWKGSSFVLACAVQTLLASQFGVVR
jgi:hypothetical protein